MNRLLIRERLEWAGDRFGFFLRFGFTATDWHYLANALLRHARENDVVATERTAHGMRYAVDGKILAPDGTALNVRSACYIRPGSDPPRFVTAHPLRKL